ncbi:MAG TPA: VCBS repeat-containing protein [Terracidiphilus sp.]
MIRTHCAPIAMIFLLAAVMVSSAHGWAAGPGASPPAKPAAGAVSASPDDDSDDTPALIVTADFNRDGIADIAEVAWPEGNSTGPRYLTLFLGQKDGTFKEADSSPVLGHDPQSIVVDDLNGDGIPDVIVGDADGTLLELLGDGKGNLIPAGSIGHIGSVASIAVGDFNRDGILDLAVSDPHANAVTVFLGTGNGSFRAAWTFALPRPGTVFQLVAADFNGDGIPDLAVTNEDQDTFEVMIGNGNGTFTYEPKLSHLADPNAHCVT